MRTHAHARKPACPVRGAARLARLPAGPLATPGRVHEVLHGPRVQAKLTVGPPGDAYEREADRVADAVMRMPEPEGRVQRVCAECEEEVQRQPVPGEDEEEKKLQRKAAPGQIPEVTPDLESRIAALRGGGQPLPSSERAFFEPRFGRDFGDVRVHTGPEAADLAQSVQARAFTLGSSVVLGKGEDSPGTEAGRKLLAHELTHVIQQTSGSPEVAARLQRFSSPELDKIEDLLSYGVFDLAITDSDAVEALTILQGLPKVQQAEFVSNTKYLDRLRDNLPDERKPELESIVTGASGSVPAKETVDDIIDKLSYGLFDWAITDKEAIQALESLKKLSGDQLAVTLNRINYGRLLENLPENRKKEMIDLLAKGLGTGGVKDTSEQASPGAVLKSLKFTSDHGVMKDNTKDWTNSGSRYPEPEWTVDAEGKSKSHPISHTKDSLINVNLGFDVIPVGAGPEAVKITGTSDAGFLNFEHSGTQSGGMGQSVAMSSKAKLPNEVKAFNDKYITWTMRWGSWEHAIGRSGPHSILTTMDTPRNPADVTYKRMALAVDLVSRAGSLNPHDIVRQIMLHWTRYNLDVRYSNEWELADNLSTGAQCIDLVRFVQSIISTVGTPGTAEAVVVWAQPATATTAIESPWPHGGMSSGAIPAYPGEPTWQAALLDGDFRPNNFEAALKFTHVTTKYYPGGVTAVMDNPDQVLRVFNCLAWIKQVGSDQYEIMKVEASYRAGCSVGARHNW